METLTILYNSQHLLQYPLIEISGTIIIGIFILHAYCNNVKSLINGNSFGFGFCFSQILFFDYYIMPLLQDNQLVLGSGCYSINLDK